MLNSSRQLFGYTKDDLAVETLTLDNGILSCDIITFGAALRSLRVPDRSGIKRDVVLGYDRHFIDPRPIDCTAHLWAAFHNALSDFVWTVLSRLQRAVSAWDIALPRLQRSIR